MVDLLENVIILRGRREQIKTFEVWWELEGLGLFQNMKQMAETPVVGEIRGSRAMRPVPVAVSETLYEILGEK